MYKLIILFFLLLLSISHSIFAQDPPKKQEMPLSRILFIFDASLSMEGTWGQNKKMTIARNTLIRIVDSLERIPNVLMALRVYGHQSPVPPQDCNDTRLEVAFSAGNASAIRQKLRYINPTGTTPLAHSLEVCAKDFPKTCDDCRNIVILITDGLEECGGDPCAVAAELQKIGIILRPFVIGIGIDPNFEKSFSCIGHFYNATDEEQFSEVLSVVITQALNSTTAQVNLLDEYGKPTETDVNMTFYDVLSGKMKFNFIHTINYRGFPDTIVLDPLLKYQLKVHTLPPVTVNDIQVVPGKHTLISADVPQGYLLVKTIEGTQYRGLKYSVSQTGKNETLNFQTINETEKYITGFYDLEIPVLPPIVLKKVIVKQSSTTTVEIPRPGIVNLVLSSPGVGSIYQRNENDLKWIYNLKVDVKNESIILQPGKYLFVYRPINAKQTYYSVTKNIEIKSGSVVNLNFK